VNSSVPLCHRKEKTRSQEWASRFIWRSSSALQAGKEKGNAQTGGA